MKTMSLVKTFLVRKAFISSKHAVCFLCPPPCGPFSYQEFSEGELSYKAKKGAYDPSSYTPSVCCNIKFLDSSNFHQYHLLASYAYYFCMISSISLGVTTKDFTGKCLRFPVTRYASSYSLRPSIATS